ncbi:MAG: hypothetical protein BWY78_00621 [Alphaproteobacteria bacterium ADurb.Bin438]|nr:MAG: hypothetical protein BWY78_00621 [Alphaproteobacteria bacterium ADurb.Bin438]
MMELSFLRSPVKFFANSADPDLAIVPRSLINSLRLIPTPLSRIIKVPSFSSGIISILKFAPSSFAISGLVRARYLNLSQASEEFDTNSRKNISGSEYKELITISRTFSTSALNSIFSSCG